MPASVFASAAEDAVELQRRMEQTTSLPLDWDPDIIAALDGALDASDPSNVLDDDFILKVHTAPHRTAPIHYSCWLYHVLTPMIGQCSWRR